MFKVKVGDRVERTPYALREIGMRKPLYEGVVVWIHPARRFFVVRFAFPGGCFRESFTE